MTFLARLLVADQPDITHFCPRTSKNF